MVMTLETPPTTPRTTPTASTADRHMRTAGHQQQHRETQEGDGADLDQRQAHEPDALGEVRRRWD